MRTHKSDACKQVSVCEELKYNQMRKCVLFDLSGFSLDLSVSVFCLIHYLSVCVAVGLSLSIFTYLLWLSIHVGYFYSSVFL